MNGGMESSKKRKRFLEKLVSEAVINLYHQGM